MSGGDGEKVLLGLVLLLVVVLFKGGIGYLIGRGKGRGGVGFLLGLFLGIIGWIITACLSPVEAPPARVIRRAPSAGGFQPCPYCAEKVRVGATLCRYCKSEIAT